MLAIGNDELDRMPALRKTTHCWMCGKTHKVTYGSEVLSDGTKVPSKLLAFFKCKGKPYLCGVGGKEWRPEHK